VDSDISSKKMDRAYALLVSCLNWMGIKCNHEIPTPIGNSVIDEVLGSKVSSKQIIHPIPDEKQEEIKKMIQSFFASTLSNLAYDLHQEKVDIGVAEVLLKITKLNTGVFFDKGAAVKIYCFNLIDYKKHMDDLKEKKSLKDKLSKKKRHKVEICRDFFQIIKQQIKKKLDNIWFSNFQIFPIPRLHLNGNTTKKLKRKQKCQI